MVSNDTTTSTDASGSGHRRDRAPFVLQPGPPGVGSACVRDRGRVDVHADGLRRGTSPAAPLP